MSKPELSASPLPDDHSSQQQTIEHIELLAEKADVQVEQYLTGQLLVKKVVREQTIQIPVLLTEEVLVIEYQANTTTTSTTTNHIDALEHAATPTQIKINGETITLNDKQMIEIPLYQEQAVVHKKVVITEQVDIGKITTQHQVNQTVVLQHEELDIQTHTPK